MEMKKCSVLKENVLRNIIQESVKEILKESYWNSLDNISWEDMNDPDFWYEVATELYTIEDYKDEIAAATGVEDYDLDDIQMWYKEIIENFVNNIDAKKYVLLEVNEDAVREDLDELFQTDIYSYD